MTKGRTSIKITEEMQDIIVQRATEGKTEFEIAQELGISKRILNYRGRKYIEEGYKIREANLLPLPKRVHSIAPAEKITPEQRFQIQELAGLGLTTLDIAHIIGISKPTLHGFCQDDLDIGKARAREKVTRTLFQMATDYEHPAETRFYLKAQAGWKEATQIEFPDEDGKPQPISGSSVNITLGAEKMQNLIAILNEKV